MGSSLLHRAYFKDKSGQLAYGWVWLSPESLFVESDQTVARFGLVTVLERNPQSIEPTLVAP
jgi:hypothetical protein